VDPDIEVLARTIRRLTGIEIGYYKPNQLHRRLGNMMGRVGATTFSQYARVLEADPDALAYFVDKFTINVSELFRNPEKFEQLRDHFLAPMLRRFGRLSIWSAGCSIGAEIYSVAMMMDRLDPKGTHRYLATDIDAAVIERARKGQYCEQDVRNVAPDLMCRYITRDGATWQVSDAIRSRVQFRRHDLLQDRFESGFHLILCRNVVIYFNDDAKSVLYRRFYEALVPGGALFVGGTERIPDAREIGFETTMPFFYVRPNGQAGGREAARPNQSTYQPVRRAGVSGSSQLQRRGTE